MSKSIFLLFFSISGILCSPSLYQWQKQGVQQQQVLLPWQKQGVQQQQVLLPSSCDICLTGECAHCNTPTCWYNKTGDCEPCWKDQGGYTCMNCSSYCWGLYQCAICETGGCQNCTACINSKEGACADCWYVKDPVTQLTCLADDSINDCRKCWKPDSPPIVLVPGLTSSNLNVTYSGIVAACLFADKEKQLWPIPNLTGIIDDLCYMFSMHLDWDNTTKKFESPKNIDVFTTDFGGMFGFNFGYLMDAFLQRYGYKTKQNLFGAPFDWRHISGGLDDYYKKLKLLIEDAHLKTKQKVNLIAVSYGPEIAIGFLHRMTPEWKDKYIDWWIAEAPVWAGSVVATYATTSGVPLPPAPPSFSRSLSRAFPAMFWLQPHPGNDNFTYTKDDIIVSTPSKNYSAWDLQTMFEDLGMKVFDKYEYLKNEPDLDKFAAPLVNTFVNYGYGINTSSRLIYAEDFAGKAPSSQPLVLNESGDGLVALKTSLRSKLWKDEQAARNKTLLHKGYFNQSHGGCLFPDPDATDFCFFEVMNLLVRGILPKGAE